MAELDIARVKRNIGRMIEQNAPEADIDAYVASEGTTADALRMAPAAAPVESEGPGLGATALDVGKQALSGLVTGTEAIPAAVPSLLGLAGRGVDKLLPNLADPQAASNQATLRDLIAKNRNGGIEQYLPKAETEAGKSARNIAEFIPGGLGLKGGLRPALGAGVASEAAGRVTEGTAAEPIARLAGALGGGLAGARSAENAAAKASVKALPSGDEVKDAAKGLYRKNEEATMGVRVDRAELPVFAERLKSELNRAGAREVNAKLAHDLVDDITKNTKDVYDLVKAREVYRKALYAGSPGDRLAAPIITRALDDAIDAASPLGVGALKVADREYSIAKTLQSIDKRFAKIEDQTAAANSGKNLGNKYRQGLTSLKNNERAVMGLKPDELAQIDRVIQGSPVENLLRNFSNRLGGGGGLGQTALGIGGGGAAFGLSGDPTTAAAVGGGLGFLGSALRGQANRMTAKQAKKLREMIADRSSLSGGILPSPGIRELPQQGLLAALVSSPVYRELLGLPVPAQ